MTLNLRPLEYLPWQNNTHTNGMRLKSSRDPFVHPLFSENLSWSSLYIWRCMTQQGPRNTCTHTNTHLSQANSPTAISPIHKSQHAQLHLLNKLRWWTTNHWETTIWASSHRKIPQEQYTKACLNSNQGWWHNLFSKAKPSKPMRTGLHANNTNNYWTKRPHPCKSKKEHHPLFGARRLPWTGNCKQMVQHMRIRLYSTTPPSQIPISPDLCPSHQPKGTQHPA